MLEIHTKAPDFRALDQNGKMQTLSDFKGRYIILYFYPKDDTPGCTIEACSLRDNYTVLQKNAVVIGVSADTVESHKKFAQKYHLPFMLLADTKKEIIHAYQAGGVFTKRITYIIDPAGNIEKIYPNVNPSIHAEKIVQDLGKIKEISNA